MSAGISEAESAVTTVVDERSEAANAKKERGTNMLSVYFNSCYYF